ncbi:MAG: transglycosylase SLT domain-containing protein [Micrococcales bacterium]
MGRHEAYQPTLGEKLDSSYEAWLKKHNRKRPKLWRLKRGALNPFFAFLGALSLFMVTAVDPYSGSLMAAQAITFSNSDFIEQQNFDDVTEVQVEFARGGFELITGEAYNRTFVEDAGTPDPGSAKAFAKKLGAQLGWGQDQYSCLVKLWNRESNWRYNAENKSSGAYGIPQALPGRKMASAGPDWRTNPETQVKWGVKYIQDRYDNPCNALGHSDQKGWY